MGTLKLNKKERNLALQTLLYNNRKNIKIVDDYESMICKPKTSLFFDICRFHNINMNQKILVIVNEKTSSLKLMTRNFKNVELISASNLNTLSLLKAKYILITNNSLDLNEIRSGIIKYPIITDKATRLLSNNQYSFVVSAKSDKPAIKSTIEYLFNVKVVKVNTAHLPKKKKRIGQYIGWKPHYKKAIVTLSKDDTINLFAEDN